jgi:3-oxoadipate enol-lactonase
MSKTMSETAFTTSDGARIAYCVEGNAAAPVLLLSNSLGTSMEIWLKQVPTFCERFQVIRYDSRGHGRSSSPAGDYAIARLGLDVVELLEHLGLKRVNFCGLSMGGMVGQWLGAYAPQRIEQLVLCNTSAFMGPEGWRLRIDTVRNGGMAQIADKVVDRWFTPTFIAAQPAKVAHAKQMILATDPVGYIGCCAAIRDLDLRKTAMAITARCLVVGGTADLATPLNHSEWLARALPSASLRLLPTAHLSNVECEDTFTDLVHSFLVAD